MNGLLLTLLSPVAGALALALLRPLKLAGWLNLAVSAVSFLASVWLAWNVANDDLVAGAPIHTDDRPILEFSDMDRYMTEDVAPNLERLLDHQREDLGRYFSGTLESG